MGSNRRGMGKGGETGVVAQLASPSSPPTPALRKQPSRFFHTKEQMELTTQSVTARSCPSPLLALCSVCHQAEL